MVTEVPKYTMEAFIDVLAEIARGYLTALEAEQTGPFPAVWKFIAKEASVKKLQFIGSWSSTTWEFLYNWHGSRFAAACGIRIFGGPRGKFRSPMMLVFQTYAYPYSLEDFDFRQEGKPHFLLLEERYIPEKFTPVWYVKGEDVTGIKEVITTCWQELNKMAPELTTKLNKRYPEHNCRY